MQMTVEQAMRPGLMLAFATGRGSGYMMRSEKRNGPYGGSNRRPPRRRKAGFFYIFMTLLISVILWPVGMVMLWRRKVRLQAGTKLLISLLTLCLSVFLIVFALTVPVDNPQFTEFQDKANDWLSKAEVSLAAAGDATMKKAGETFDTISDFNDAGRQLATLYAADAIDKGVDLTSKAREAIEEVLHRDKAAPGPTQAPAPATRAPKDTEAPEGTEAPEEEATQAPEASEAATAKPPFEIELPGEQPDAEDAQPLGEGTLHANGNFEPGEVEVPTDAPSAAPAKLEDQAPGEAMAEKVTQAPEEEPTEVPEEEATEAPEKEPTEAPKQDATEVPEEEPTEAPEKEPTEAPAEEATKAPEQEATEVPEEEVTEAPTEAPTQAVTEAPTDTPAPEAPYTVKPAGEAVVYFYENGSKGFHRTPTRHDMDGAPAHTLAEAFAAGKTPCESCQMPDESVLDIEHIAWVDEANRIHTSEDCERFEGFWTLMSLEDAVAAGYEACDACGADLYAEEICPAPTPTPEPEVVTPETPLKSAGELTVYYFGASKGYHVASNCVGMENAPAHTLVDALADGKHPCGNCFPPSTDLIGLPMLWLDKDGVCHTSDDCDSFVGAASLIEREDALEQGLAACPDCGAAEYLTPGTVLAE